MKASQIGKSERNYDVSFLSNCLFDSAYGNTAKVVSLSSANMLDQSYDDQKNVRPVILIQLSPYPQNR